MTLALIAALPFLGALLPGLAIRAGRTACATLTGAVTATALLLLALEAPAVLSGETVTTRIDWLPALGLNANFRLDGLGLLFAGLILGIGLLIILYARFYLSKSDPMGVFFTYLMLFQGAMVGIVLSDNILLLLIFWELTSLSSFLLIGYWKHLAEGRQGARMALAVTGGGGLALIAGMLILGNIAGSYDLSVILTQKEAIQSSDWYLPALILILLGCFTKSAQFPFHFWLPHAMAAPTPVSAYLHSATMVKAGIFLMARLWPVLAGTPEWFWAVTGVGLLTLLVGAKTALFQHDLKAILAYSTVSQLGLITTLLGLGSPAAVAAALFHLLNHATFKAALFLSAGIVDHETVTRDASRLGGLLRRNQRGHVEFVLRGQWRLDKTGVDHAHAQAAWLQVQVQGFGQVDECGLGRAIGQALRQAPKAGHAADQADVALSTRHHGGRDGRQHMQRAHGVDLMVAQQIGQVDGGGPHGVVVARAVTDQIQRASGHRCLGGGLDGGAVAHVQRQGDAARVLVREGLQGVHLACRDDHGGAQRVQLLGQRTADAGGGAHQPHTLAAPFAHGRVQAHGVCFWKDSVTSPRRMPNLLMVARLSITRSSIRYIQSSNCTSYTLPSTGKFSV